MPSPWPSRISTAAASSSWARGRDTAYAARLRSLAESLGVAGDITWVGGVRLEETVDFYRAADVFVYPSHNETFGLPLLEAMACGCPVVTSDRSAMPETAGGAAALFADPADPGSIAAAIVRACGDRWTDPARPGTPARRGVHLGGRPRRRPWRCTARCTRARRGVNEGPRHGRSRFHRVAHVRPLVELGHEVTILDALTAPVHRDGTPNYLDARCRPLGR